MKQLGLVLGVMAVAACGKADGDFDRAVSSGEVSEARHALPSRPTAAASPGTLERRILDVEGCALEGHQIDTACPAMEKLSQDLARPGASTELSLALGKRLLAHPAATVRIATAGRMGADAASRAAIAEVARREVAPAARQAFVRILADDAAHHPPAAAFLLASATHPDAGVRLAALDALTRPANRALPGGAAALIGMVERDPDPAVRRAACAAGGKLGTDELLPLYERSTATADDPELYAACMEGLVAMFHDHARFATANERAYRLFLTRIAQTPRSEHVPPWRVVSAFCYSSDDDDRARLAAWQARAPWFDAAEVQRAMAAIVTDPAASWQARSAAVESMLGLGAGREELAALQQQTPRKSADDQRVHDKLARAIPR